MSKKLLDRVLGGLGLMEEVEVEEERNEREDIETKVKRGTVVNLHTAQKQMKVVVVEPRQFDEAQLIADHLKNRKPVIITLEETDREVALRIVDFVSGTTYGLNGTIQKIGNHIFLFAPNNVDIAFNQRDEVGDKNMFSWAR